MPNAGCLATATGWRPGLATGRRHTTNCRASEIAFLLTRRSSSVNAARPTSHAPDSTAGADHAYRRALRAIQTRSVSGTLGPPRCSTTRGRWNAPDIDAWRRPLNPSENRRDARPTTTLSPHDWLRHTRIAAVVVTTQLIATTASSRTARDVPQPARTNTVDPSDDVSCQCPRAPRRWARSLPVSRRQSSDRSHDAWREARGRGSASP